MTENSSLTSDLQGLSFLRNDGRKGGKYQLLTSVECEHRPHWRELQAVVALQVTTELLWQGREEKNKKVEMLLSTVQGGERMSGQLGGTRIYT